VEKIFERQSPAMGNRTPKRPKSDDWPVESSLVDVEVTHDTSHELCEISIDGMLKVEDEDGKKMSRKNVSATFAVQTSSMAVRMKEPMKICLAEALMSSNFQSHYQGSGIPRNVDNETVLDALMEHVFEAGISLAEPAFNQHSFVSAGGSKNVFKIDDSQMWYSTTNPLADLQEGRVMSVVQTSSSEELCVVLAGPTGPKGWLVRPVSFRETTKELFPLMTFTGGCHNFPQADRPERQGRSISGVAQVKTAAKHQVENLVVLYDLKATHGCTKLYTSDVEIFGQKFYRTVTFILNTDDADAMPHLVQFVRRVNYYINETKHAGGRLFSGCNIGDEGWDLVTGLARGSCIRIPRIWSTTSSESVANMFKTDAMIVIHAPENFWGARVVSDISDFPTEDETVFPPYSQFVLIGFDRSKGVIELAAIDKYYGLEGGYPYPPKSYPTLPASAISFLPSC